jgi:Outer membrane receptor proteins, mostly Fe transport
LSDTSELTLCARWYDIEVLIEGSANSSFYKGLLAPDTQQFGTNLSAQYAPGKAKGYPDKASTDGVIGKVTYSWNPSDEVMYYVTWSEGFRPGLLNRPAGRTSPDGSYTGPPSIDSEEITNYELGWKTVLMDGQLRIKGRAFWVDIEGLQSTVSDPSMVNRSSSENAAEAEITGVEGD